MVEDQNILNQADRAPTGRFHLKAIFVASMGFFTDAYDLFAISTALPLIVSASVFDVTNHFVQGLVGAAVLIGAVIGALTFGRIGDIRGRKYVYGVEMAILVTFAVISAFSVNIWMLIITRLLLGIGIGGDYPISSTIMSEYSNVKSRGKMVQTVFAMQGFGLLLGAVIGLIAIHTMPVNYAWRFMLGFGAIPAASVIYLRRKIKETPRYSLQTKGDVKAAAAAVEDITGSKIDVKDSNINVSKKSGILTKYIALLIGTAGSWFLFDMAFYGTSINNSIIFNAIGYGSVTNAVLSASNTAIGNIIIAAAFEIPGYWIAFGLIDRVGRKFLQWMGFSVMGIIYLIFALAFAPLKADIPLFIGLYGLSFLFANIGPNSTTFILPTELFPTQVRTTAHGISAGAGKTGAAIFTFALPSIEAALGLKGVFALLTGFSFIAVIITLLFIRETKQKSLEQTSRQDSVMAH
ncbi:MFS transporter [Picrophilus oshimae]|uniref:Phosphate transporter n=1 Tax=Picrophilus torridus (strain ATCC 700027 / DSM 9790 / JCM 10055 / NBRC 100828 / KAW 2/3) TaxID=1122961 RepID=Q6L2X3_PICTO|nr:MFS transporter [Picrophilus oshimae]AAT42678.1 phosphate transporter [Picrophilus oshimae DSM 9789]